MRPLPFTSDLWVLCVFLTLSLWGVTGFSAALSPAVPPNAEEFKSVGQTETSVTLRWKKVENILSYTLVFNGREINVTASERNVYVTETILDLNSGTKYDFSLFTVFENIRSSGVNLTAATVPPNAEEFKSVGQTETSVTLQWKKVQSFTNYLLKYNRREINVTAQDGNVYVTQTILDLNSGTKYDFSLFTVFENIRSSGVNLTAATVPPNAEEFKSVGQTETSVTLQWKKVESFTNYLLKYNGREINVTASERNVYVTQTILDLSSGTKYDFSLFTVFENNTSSGVNLAAATAPRNTEEFKSVGQTETSVTLQWKKVGNILSYTLVFNGREINVTAQDGNVYVTQTISGLSSGTKYDFSLFTVFENIRSSGVNLTAATVPPNAEEFKSVGQTETSVTLQWKKVESFTNYLLKYNGREINVTAQDGNEYVTQTILDLNSGTKYDFSLFTVFENIRSSGVNLTAATVPRNTEEITSVEQNETSVTLQWKKVGNILSYTLVFNGREINVTASDINEYVTETISGLSSGTKYDFSLFTVFENIRSSGVNLTAATVPRNTEEITSVEQNETSVTLQWKKVENILSYTLVFNGREINVTASDRNEYVTQTISGLSSGTKYDFSLFTVFENIRSSGVNLAAATVPPNAEEFKSVGQTETSVTLQWKKVESFTNYLLKYNGREINVTAQDGNVYVTQTILDLNSGTKYDFSLFTVFENNTSSGVNLAAATAPRNTEEFKSVGQTETSVTLQWKKVGNILSYTLVFNGREKNVTAQDGNVYVTETISGLSSGTKYDFSLFTVFENIRSSGVNLTAATAPRNTEEFKSVGQTETSVTLQWKKVGNILSYTLVFNGREINVTAQDGNVYVTETISRLSSGTKYDFSLFTVFENIRSSGVNLTAATAPLHAEEFTSVGQNETSVTLQWKKVGNILSHTLVFNGREINVTASEENEYVTKTISELSSGTKYDFSLFTVFENIRSRGVNLTAATAPRNAQEFKSVGRTETSVTLQWKKVQQFSTYTLVYNGREINVTAQDGNEHVTQTIPDLSNGTKYDFRLFTVFENIRSSGVNLAAATVPGITEEFTSVGQNETSVTLQWKKVGNIHSYTLVFNGREINVTASERNVYVTQTISGLSSGTKYDFSLFTVFENFRSSGVNLTAATVPPAASLVTVSERSVTRVTLKWDGVNRDWSYLLQINGLDVTVSPDNSLELSSSVTSLKPGTEYPFSVTTMFSGLNSTAYTGFTVTAIDCANVFWHLTNTSIQGNVQGLFSNATASYNQTHVSPEGSNVSFTGLYPGATYEVCLVYNKHSTSFEQCRHNLTILPPTLSAHCEYWNAGYSINIVWNKPYGLWTAVEVTVSEQSHTFPENGEQHATIHGFLPAQTYTVSLVSLSGTVRRSDPVVFSCATDPRGVIAGASLGVLLFCILVLLVVVIIYKRPNLIRNKKLYGGSKGVHRSYKPIHVSAFPAHYHGLSADDNRGFSDEYKSLAPVGTTQKHKVCTLPGNKAKNRFNNILPYDWSRVKLNTSKSKGRSDYINANYIPGYNSKKEFIATQGPLPSTVNDFWRMIWEQRVKGIVMVTNCTEGGRPKCDHYWPEDSTPRFYKGVRVTITSEQEETYWTLREFSVKHIDSSEERTVIHFHFTAWPDHGVPEGTIPLIQFRGLVRSHMEKEGAGAPTVVHCSAGVGRTGTLIALDVLLQQLGHNNAVSVYAVVHKMRQSRTHMVQTEWQYIFLHQCIMDCLEQDKTEDTVYENVDMMYANATALRELR
uniref:receptor-type tyrosine-protein phosphatase H-like isoform X2 n=1 Tax=Solea senegalensis TaxID=28829 RepID=UPI001CD8F494|nr:receptor-type tyrosine-protein phosphatase H-like isoform X2 [Solea senegalensis]